MRLGLEVKTQFYCKGSRRHIVGPTKGGNKIVEGLFIHYVDCCQAEAPLVLVTIEEVIFAHREVEEVAGRDPGWVVVVVFGAGRRNLHIFGRVLVRRANAVSEW